MHIVLNIHLMLNILESLRINGFLITKKEYEKHFFSRHKYAWFVSNQLFHKYDKHDNMRDNDIYKYM